MGLDRIEKLLENYFEAATSSAEENELKVYFSSSDVAQHLKQYQPVFGYFTQEKEQQFMQKISLKAKKRNLVLWLSIAASVIVMLGSATFVYFENINSNHFIACSSDDNPELVLQETQRALTLVSEHLNTGIVSVNYIKEYETAKNRIFKK